MKRIVLPFILIVFAYALLSLSANVQAQTVNKEEPMKELILGIPKASEKSLSMVIETIEQVTGIEFYQYCPEHNLFLIKYDKFLFPNKEDVVRAIEDQKLSMQMYVKEGDFNDVKDMCIN